jgi:hypothetical protein
MTLHVGHYTLGNHRMSILNMIAGVIIIPITVLLILFTAAPRPW